MFDAATKERIDYVAKLLGMSIFEIIERDNRQKKAEARHILAYMMYNYIGVNVPEIAKFLERDRTTMICNLREIERLMSVKQPFSDRLKDIVEKYKKHFGDWD